MSSYDPAAYDEQIIQEFLGEAADYLNELEILLENTRSRTVDAEVTSEVTIRVAHSLKGAASIAGFKLISKVAHHMEDYIKGIQELTDDVVEGLQIYVDTIRDLVEDYTETGNLPDEELLDRLPKQGDSVQAAVKSGDDFEVSPGEDMKIMQVIPDRTSSRFFERELVHSGFPVVKVSNSEEAMEQAIAIQPDFLVISALIDDMSGVDLILKLKAEPITCDLKMGLLTSFERSAKELEGLPDEVPIIRKNKFSEDIGDAMVNMGVFSS